MKFPLFWKKTLFEITVKMKEFSGGSQIIVKMNYFSGGSQEAPRRLPGSSQEALGKLSGGPQETP